MLYKVLQLIWHTKDQKHYEPGQIVSLDHLPESSRQMLVERGVVKSYAGETAEPLEGAQEGVG